MSGMQRRVDGRDEERRRNLVAVQHLQNARRAALGAEVGRGERGRRRVAVAQQRRFRVVVEAQTDGDAGAVGPRLRRELPADARRDRRPRAAAARSIVVPGWFGACCWACARTSDRRRSARTNTRTTCARWPIMALLVRRPSAYNAPCEDTCRSCCAWSSPACRSRSTPSANRCARSTAWWCDGGDGGRRRRRRAAERRQRRRRRGRGRLRDGRHASVRRQPRRRRLHADPHGRRPRRRSSTSASARRKRRRATCISTPRAS